MIKEGQKLAVLSFDTESNIGSWTQNYSSIDDAMPKILNLLSEKNVEATFVWEAKAALHNPDMIVKTNGAGHECGCHSYQHESVGKPSYFIPGDRAILSEEVPLRLGKNYEVVKDILNQNPYSFRAPRLWCDEIVISALEALGFGCESSYAIGKEGDNLFPYHPSPEDISKEGDMNILELPVAGIYGDMLDDVAERLRDFGQEVTKDSCQIPQWPVLRLYGAELFRNYLNPLIEKQMKERNYSVVTLYLHPWEFMDMPSKIECPEGVSHLARTLHENCGDYTLNALGEFIDLLKDEGFEFVTMQHLRRLYEE